MSDEQAFKSVAGISDKTNDINTTIQADSINTPVELNVNDIQTESETTQNNETTVPSPSNKRDASLLRTQTIEDQSNVDKHQTHDEHTPADHVRNVKPWKLHTLIAKCPCLCCCFFFGWFIICGLIIAVIPGILEMTTEVPFYIRNNEPTTLKDALIAGKNDAAWERQSSTDIQKQQQVGADVSLKLIYKVKGSNTLMQKEYLELMDKIEQKVQATTGFDKYCKRLYTGKEVNDTDENSYKCARQNSITNFFDKTYFKPSLDRGYSLYPSLVPNLQFYLLPSSFIDGTIELTNKNYSQEFIDAIVSYWAGYDQGHGPKGKYQKKYYNGQEMPAKFYYQKLLNGEITNFSLGNIFGSIAGKNFAYDTPFDTDVDVAMTSISFGLPLEGYDSQSDNTADQQSEIGKWCFDELHDTFTEFAEKYEDKLEFYWGCSDMTKYYSNWLLVQDGLYMLATFTSVYLLMIFNTGSVWLATCGMAMIFLNFLPAILLYRYISGLEYFGTLCIMAMFIILSIGADDIFVINDTWQQYRTAAPNEPIDKRLTATLKHAGKVMATTSASTCFSFIGNTTSVFPGVYTFGAFAAWLVFVNYCAVVLFYPTVLAVHEKYFYTPNLKRGCCCTKRCGANTRRCCCMDNIKPSFETELDDDEKQRPIDKFFELQFFPIIYQRKRNILAASFIFFLIFFFLATKLEADPEIPQFYPNGNNYQEYGDELSSNFASQTFYQLTTQIVWGIEGIDRTGTDDTIPDDIGKVIYSNNISFIAPEEQLYLAQFCDDLLCVYSEHNCRYPQSTYYDLLISDPENYGGNPISVVKCFMTEFRDWILTDSAAKPSQTEIEKILNEYDQNDIVNASDFTNCNFGEFPVEGSHCFALLFAVLWMNDDIPTSNPDFVAGVTNYDYWKDYLYVKEKEIGDYTSVFSPIDLKFFTVSVLTDASVTYPYNDGIKLFNNWQIFGQNWRDNIDGQNSDDKNGNTFIETPSSLKSIMVTDRIIFSYFYQQKQIIREAIFGIGLSLIFAFIIITLATQNWIMSLYSCFVIFSIVVCVMGFSIINGWKLGIIEAIIYVMVVGMSVDYVVHLSEAYLASGKQLRIDRSRRMLGIVGGSVLSGAISTLIGILWLFFATIVIFKKFGAFIFFLIFISLTFSMVSFTAAMSSFGPQGSTGNIILCAKKCCKCFNSNKKMNVDKQKSVNHVEML